MTAAAVTNSNNRLEDFVTLTVFDSGTGKAGAIEGVIYYQGAESVSRKIATTALGGTGAIVASTDMTVGDDRVWMAKGLITDFQDVNAVGWSYRAGSSLANLRSYIVLDDTTLGDRSTVKLSSLGWWVVAIAVDDNDWWDLEPATTPTRTAMTHFQVAGGFATGAAKAENLYLDAVDLGDGLWIVEGGNGNDDATWADLLLADEGTLSTGRFGHVLSNANGLEIRGKIVRGRTSAAATTRINWTGSLANIIWVGDLVYTGWNELEDDLTNANSVLVETGTTLGGGPLTRNNLKRYFDSSADEVDDTNEVFTITAHGYLTGEAVLYSIEGGTVITGLADATRYFVNRDTGTARGVDGFSLHAARADAYTNTAPIAVTAAATGEEHSFTRQPDNRPVYNATGTSASTSTFDTCNLVRWASWNQNSSVVLIGCNYTESGQLDMNGGTLTSCTVSDATLDIKGGAAVTCADLADIATSTFVQSTNTPGHGAERTGTAGSDGWSGNILTGFWVHGGDAGDGAAFTTDSGGVDGVGEDVTTTNTHGFTTGDYVFYNDNAGVATIGLTHDAGYYVNVISTTNVSFHVTKADAVADANRVALNTSGAETHTLYSARAAVVNATNGAHTISVTDGASTPYVRNVDAATTTVTAAVTVTVTPVFVGSEVRAFLTGTATETGGGVENSAGTSVGLSLGSGVAVDIVVLSTPTSGRPTDTAAIPVRLENVNFTVSQNLDPQQKLAPNFTNP